MRFQADCRERCFNGIDPLDLSATAGLAATIAPEGGIIGPIVGIQATASGGTGLSGQFERHASLAAEIDIGLKTPAGQPVHLEAGVQTDFEGGPAPLIGAKMPF